MRNKKRILLLFVALVNTLMSFSQNEIDYEEHRKYWYY